jgi:hypothetical protein
MRPGIQDAKIVPVQTWILGVRIKKEEEEEEEMDLFLVADKKWVCRNPSLMIGLLVEICLVLCLSYVPALHTVFGTQNVSWKIWVISLPFLCFVILADEFRKLLIRQFPKSKCSFFFIPTSSSCSFGVCHKQTDRYVQIVKL